MKNPDARSHTLPVAAQLPAILTALNHQTALVIVAPPGSGKTTLVPPAMLDAPWCTGSVIVLAPRRLAVRAAAERMAALRGEDVGKTIGYMTRFDSATGAETRLFVMTPGLFVQRILTDPELSGVSAVVFDEVHERGIDSDFALALTLDAQPTLRPDLRIVAMSATVDAERLAARVGGQAGPAPIIAADGAPYPLTLRHVGRRSDLSLADDVAHVVTQALADSAHEPTRASDALVFVPTVADVHRVADRVQERHAALSVHRLHGQADMADQRAALRPDPDGRRKVIVATSIAESSLTVPGVAIVIDSGMARRARYDPAVGIARLVTERASQAAVTQRAGRAARTQAGIAWRLWDEGATAGFLPFDPPEVAESDLAATILRATQWGARDVASLPWIDAPPAARVQEARDRLRMIGALDADDHLTNHGRQIAPLALAPELAHMIVRAREAGDGDAGTAALIAVLIGEQGLGGRDVDLSARFQRVQTARDARSVSARKLATRLAASVAAQAGRVEPPPVALDTADPGTLLALAYPGRVARRRAGQGGATLSYVSRDGRGYVLDATDALARHEWIVIADAQGSAQGARVMLAAGIDAPTVLALFADAIEDRVEGAYDAASDRVTFRAVRRLGAIALREGSVPREATSDIDVATRLDAVRKGGLAMLSLGAAVQQWLTRARFAGMEAVSEAALMATLDTWLAPVLAGARGLRDIADRDMLHALMAQLSHAERQQVERVAPPSFTTPAGTTHAIDYAAEAGPTVTVRVQALFGLATHPTVGQPPVPLVLELTSPAHRPVQTTRDLPRFWAGSWADVRRDMRGRYPKHHWPDDPLEAPASLRTKARQGL